MSDLERLIDDPSVTVEQILDVARDPQEVMEISGQVFAEVERANQQAEKAMAANLAAIARLQEALGTEHFGARLAEQDITSEEAKAAIVAQQETWKRYQPWREALDRIDRAIELRRTIESN